MTNLEKALADIANNKIEPDGLEKAFDEIAIELLQKTKLVAGKSHYLIKEIEFYFSSDHYNHIDQYAHSNQYPTCQRQGEFGEWYFHRFSKIESFLKSNRNGVDITFGNKAIKPCLFGGILIRGIQNAKTKTEEPILGINKVVRELIKNIGEQNIEEIAFGFGQQVFSSEGPLRLEKNENNFSLPIYKTTRVIPKHDTEGKREFYSKFYRYFNFPEIKLVKP